MSEFFDPTDKKNKPVLDYFSDKDWLVIEVSSSTRNSIKKTISQLGSKLSNMHDADNFIDAQKIIKSQRPKFVIGNKNITGGSTVSLFQDHLTAVPDRLKGGFFIITDENSVAEVALFLEYDMDGIVSSPFTGSTIISTLLDGVKNKIKPSPYLKKISDGQSSYLKGNLELANADFKDALGLHKHPYEGHYFLGRINHDNGLEDEALKCYEEAVSHNSIFYKGLKALCSMYYQKKNYSKAYDANLLMANSFPTSPSRIPELIRLSIINQKYEDISNYLKIAQGIQTQNSEIQIYLAAGLATLGRYFSSTNDVEKGIEALIGAFDFSNGKYEILKSITGSFQNLNKLDILVEKFNKIDISTWSNESQGFYFHSLHKTSNDDNQVMQLGGEAHEE